MLFQSFLSEFFTIACSIRLTSIARAAFPTERFATLVNFRNTDTEMFLFMTHYNITQP